MSSPGSYRPGSRHQAKVLVVVAGPAAGARIPFTGELRLGRVEDGGHLGGDPALSRHHAVLRDQPDGLTTIEDLGSANGTYVNGRKISGIQQVHIGDTVELGASSLRLTAESGAETARAPEPRLRARSPRGDERSRGDEFPRGGVEESAEETGWAQIEPLVSKEAGQLSGSAVVPQKRGSSVGTVSSVSRRADAAGKSKSAPASQVLTFRLEQFTEHGDRRGVITVELRGLELSGDVAVGDRVEAIGRIRGGVLHAKVVHNLTTGGTVSQTGQAGRRLRAAAAVAAKLALILLILGAMTLFVLIATRKVGGQ
jgi:hypothetical protein